MDLGVSGAIRKRNEAPDALPGTGDVRMTATMVMLMMEFFAESHKTVLRQMLLHAEGRQVTHRHHGLR